MSPAPRGLLALIAAALLAGLLFVYHQSGRKTARSMELAVEDGLKRFYESNATNQAVGTNGTVLAPEVLRESLRKEFAHRRFLPSLVRPEDTFVSSVPVPLGTSNLLLCVTQPWKSAKYGVDGTGQFRMVTDPEFQKWPHTSMSIR